MEEEVKILEKPHHVARTINIEDHAVRTYHLSPEMMQDVKEAIIHTLKSDPRLIKEIINETLKPNEEEITFQTIDKDEAKQKILKHIEKHPGCKTSDIIFSLNIEPTQVLEILKELKEGEIVQSKSIGR